MHNIMVMMATTAMMMTMMMLTWYGLLWTATASKITTMMLSSGRVRMHLLVYTHTMRRLVDGK